MPDGTAFIALRAAITLRRSVTSNHSRLRIASEWKIGPWRPFGDGSLTRPAAGFLLCDRVHALVCRSQSKAQIPRSGDKWYWQLVGYCPSARRPQFWGNPPLTTRIPHRPLHPATSCGLTKNLPAKNVIRPTVHFCALIPRLTDPSFHLAS